jgi:hypothetical protein
MKAMFKASILLNIVLLSGFLFLLPAGRKAHSEATPPAQLDEAPSAVDAAVPATAVPAKGDKPPFNWSQVESSDYRTYIANLRSIGFPEQTIRDIITADVDSQYAPRRELLEQKLIGNAFAERVGVETRLQEVRNEDASAVNLLLGAPATAATTRPAAAAEGPFSGSARVEPAADTASMPVVTQDADPSAIPLNKRTSEVALEATPSRSLRQAPPAAISLPLVFQDIDPSVLSLNAQQAQVVDDLRQKFIEAVGGPNQDPSDPAYSQRWQASQPQADLDLRGMIGISAWEGYQIAAWAKAHNQTPSGP